MITAGFPAKDWQAFIDRGDANPYLIAPIASELLEELNGKQEDIWFENDAVHIRAFLERLIKNGD